MRPSASLGLLALALTAGSLAGAPTAQAQSTGFVTGIPGPDPAGDDGIGWGPSYRPETTYSQPGTVPTPGDYAGWAYRARTGRGPYDGVQAPLTTGALGNGSYAYGSPGPGYVDETPPPRHGRTVRRHGIER